MSDLHFTPGMDAFAFAHRVRMLDRRDEEELTLEASPDDPSIRYTSADPNCVDHELPGSKDQAPRTILPAGAVIDLATGRFKN